jgi:transposase InsO family protein
VQRSCGLLGYSRQALYKKAHEQEKKFIKAEVILQQVHHIRSKHKRMGVKKLHIKLESFFKTHGIKLGRDALFDLLREFGMLVKSLKRSHYTTDSYHRFYKYPSLIKSWSPAAPNQLWVSDITYIEVKDGFSYLSVITDAFSHKIVGWHLAKSPTAQASMEALRMALKNNKDIQNLIHHSDRGAQYCSQEYVSLLKSKGIKISMTEHGDPYENAMAERINGIIKNEYLDKKYDNDGRLWLDVSKTVRLYNTDREHMSIGMYTPDYIHQTGMTTKNLWKKKTKQTNHINSKGNNVHAVVSVISP